MTRPATLPELLAQGKVKPGGLVLLRVTSDLQEMYRHGEKFRVDDDGFIREASSDGSLGTFRPVKPAKAKKWSDWEPCFGGTVAEWMACRTGIQVKRTKDGSLMIRYRRKG